MQDRVLCIKACGLLLEGEAPADVAEVDVYEVPAGGVLRAVAPKERLQRLLAVGGKAEDLLIRPDLAVEVLGLHTGKERGTVRPILRPGVQCLDAADEKRDVKAVPVVVDKCLGPRGVLQKGLEDLLLPAAGVVKPLCEHDRTVRTGLCGADQVDLVLLCGEARRLDVEIPDIGRITDPLKRLQVPAGADSTRIDLHNLPLLVMKFFLKTI